MPGFNNGVMWADNVRFDGTQYPGQVTTDGQLLIGATVVPNIRVNTLTQGPGIIITNGPGTITISAVLSTVWSAVSSATNPNTLVTGSGYIPKGAPAVVFVLPAAAALGDTFHVAGHGNLWTIQQNALQTITLGAQTTTPGVLGSVTATSIKDCAEIVCVTANTEFEIIRSIGNLTIV